MSVPVADCDIFAPVYISRSRVIIRRAVALDMVVRSEEVRPAGVETLHVRDVKDDNVDERETVGVVDSTELLGRSFSWPHFCERAKSRRSSIKASCNQASRSSRQPEDEAITKFLVPKMQRQRVREGIGWASRLTDPWPPRATQR